MILEFFCVLDPFTDWSKPKFSVFILLWKSFVLLTFSHTGLIFFHCNLLRIVTKNNIFIVYQFRKAYLESFKTCHICFLVHLLYISQPSYSSFSSSAPFFLSGKRLLAVSTESHQTGFSVFQTVPNCRFAESIILL